MDEHERNEIKLGLVNVLSRPKLFFGFKEPEGKQPMQNDAQKHSESPEGIQVVVSFGCHSILIQQPKSLRGYL